MVLWIMSIPLFSLAKTRSSPWLLRPTGAGGLGEPSGGRYEQFTPTILVGQSAILASKSAARQSRLLSIGMYSSGG